MTIDVALNLLMLCMGIGAGILFSMIWRAMDE